MKLIFSSYHNYLDRSSGAALTIRSALIGLAKRGWDVRVLCGSYFDSLNANLGALYREFKRLGITPTISKCRSVINGRPREFKLARFNDSGVSGSILIDDEAFSTRRFRNDLSRDAGLLFLKTLDVAARKDEYDVYLTYGGYWAAKEAANIMKERAKKNVFYLFNLAYNDRALLQQFDLVITPSPFAREYYMKTLSIDSTPISPFIDKASCLARERRPQYLTLINPSPEKGGRFALGVFWDLQKKRDDIPILVAEGRGDFKALVAATPKARKLKNVHLLKGSVDARAIYAKTRLLLVPSLCGETFGRVPVEAAFNGVPALVSNRGALPDVVGDPEYVLPIPERFTPKTCELPTPLETQPWVDAILKHWDGSLSLHDSEHCSKLAQRFDSEKILTDLERALKDEPQGKE